MTHDHGVSPRGLEAACNSTVDLHVRECKADRHGTENAHAGGCRCPAARRDHYLKDKARKVDRLGGNPRRIDATGTHRRLRALMALGWRAQDLAPRIGWACGELSDIFRRPTVHRDTAAAVRRVYDALSDVQGPSEQTRRGGARKGWLPPIWWDDDTIDDPTHSPVVTEPTRPQLYDVDPVNVDRAIAGQTVDLTRGERLAVVRHLHTHGHGYRKIADRLCIAQRQVHRDLTDLGLLEQEEGAA